MNETFLEELVSRRPAGPLYHYTNQAGLLGIVRNKEIWATHTQYLNDSQECRYALQLIREEFEIIYREQPSVRNALAATTLEYDKESEVGAILDFLTDPAQDEQFNAFVASFSEVRDSLSQWRAYATPSGGVSMSFDSGRLFQLTSPNDFQLLPCIYDQDEQKELVRTLVDRAIDWTGPQEKRMTQELRSLQETAFLALFNTYGPLLKHPSFADEREWRIITGFRGSAEFREGKSTLVPYNKVQLYLTNEAVPLEEVVVGPTPDPDRSRWAVRAFLDNSGLQSTDVACSSVPYRNW